jgi:hypothetical protein
MNKEEESVQEIEGSTTKHQSEADETADVNGKKINHRRWISKVVGIRFIFLLIALIAFLGLADKLCYRVMKPVWTANEEFLEKSMIYASGGVAVLVGVDGVLSMAQSVVAEPEIAGSKVGSVGIGELISPTKGIVNDLREYLVLSIFLIITQIAIIKLISAISLKVLLGIGSGLCVFQYKRGTLCGKVGASFMIIGLLFYFVYPLAFKAGTDSYKAHQIETSIELSENFGVLKEQVADVTDVNFSPQQLISQVKQIPMILGQGIETAWDGTMGLFVGILIMFVFVPLLSLGAVYLIGRHALRYLDMPAGEETLGTAVKTIKDRLMPRSRLRMSER